MERGTSAYSVCGGGLWLHLNAASASGAILSELDVALIAPGGVPGVLHEPVVLAILGSVADDEHGMVEVGATAG